MPELLDDEEDEDDDDEEEEDEDELLELELLELELLELDDPLLLPVLAPQPDNTKPAAAMKARLMGDFSFGNLHSNCMFINPAGVLFLISGLAQLAAAGERTRATYRGLMAPGSFLYDNLILPYALTGLSHGRAARTTGTPKK